MTSFVNTVLGLDFWTKVFQHLNVWNFTWLLWWYSWSHTFSSFCGPNLSDLRCFCESWCSVLWHLMFRFGIPPSAEPLCWAVSNGWQVYYFSFWLSFCVTLLGIPASTVQLNFTSLHWNIVTLYICGINEEMYLQNEEGQWGWTWGSLAFRSRGMYIAESSFGDGVRCIVKVSEMRQCPLK